MEPIKPSVGMEVEINPQSDKTRKIRIVGIVDAILSKKIDHPHGALVRLKSGEVGRVKKNLGVPTATEMTHSTAEANDTSILPVEILIQQGESHIVEFKDRALWSANYTNDDIKSHKPPSKELFAFGQATSKVIIAKILASFLNTSGGTLIIGVEENKQGGLDQVIGIEQEYSKLKDPCQDGYRRMIVDLIKDYFPSHIFNHLGDYIEISFDRIENNKVCVIRACKSDKKVFLKFLGRDYFFIRTDASTRELTGEEVVEYCEYRFR